jgi:hypothetical protein
VIKSAELPGFDVWNIQQRSISAIDEDVNEYIHAYMGKKI